MPNEIIVVTGSSGFLGQHIIKHLHKDDNVSLIRLFDKVPYKNKLGHEELKPVEHIVADVCDFDKVKQAVKGADCVIHVAAVIDISLNPDLKNMVSTNVDGTKNVIEACCQENVPRLVFASTTDMVCGTEHIFYGTESTTPIPTSWMIGEYGKTKYESEKLVLEASERLLENGQKLRTVAIRPTPLYGEQDTSFFIKFLQIAKKHHGYYLRIRSLDERMQITYAGNAAVAFLKAKDRLVHDETISGEAFFVTDDTPIIDIHEHLAPLIEGRGFKVSSFIFPYWLAWLILSLVLLLIKFINVFVKFEVDIPPVTQLNYMCSTFFYNRAKATLRLDYEPVYPPEEAKKLSSDYYLKVPL